jgi:fructose-1,6-bisphosphatase
MSFKSILKPEASTVAGLASVGTVFAVYQLNIGSVAQAAATDSNHPVLESSRKKAGYTAFGLIAILTLLTKDANVAILGGGTIIAMELSYRHGIMANPQSMRMQNPSPATAYEPAENVIPLYQQGETA